MKYFHCLEIFSLTQTDGAAAATELLDVLAYEEVVLVPGGPGDEPDVGDAADVTEDLLYNLPLLSDRNKNFSGLNFCVRKEGFGLLTVSVIISDIKLS